MRKISKKVREDAANVLSIAACSHVNLGSAAAAIGASECARELAHDAFYDFSVPFIDPWYATYAAAEQLLRTGWSWRQDLTRRPGGGAVRARGDRGIEALKGTRR